MIKYLRESFTELNNVTWPTRKRGVKITTIVLVFMILSAAVFGFVDYLFSLGIKELIKINPPTVTAPQTPSTEVAPTEVTPSPDVSQTVNIVPNDAESTDSTTLKATPEDSNAPTQNSTPEVTPQAPSETNPS